MMSTVPSQNESNENKDELSKDEIYSLLSSRRRRFVIHALKRDGATSVSDLSRYVTAWEAGIKPEAVEYEDRRSVYVTLKNTHLPKLEEKNILIHDDEDVVKPTPQLKEIEVYVEAIGSRDIPWSDYFIGLTVVAAALLLAVATGVPGFAALTPLDVGIVIVTAFGVSSAAYHYIGRRTRLGNGDKPPELRKSWFEDE